MQPRRFRPSLLLVTSSIVPSLAGCVRETLDAGPRSHAEAAGPPALKARAKDLERTVVTAHLKERIEPGRNVLWCNTFQLAWNELCRFLGEDVRVQNEPPMAPILNEKLSTRADIDEESYVALAGAVDDGVIGRIERALDEKFKGLASPEFVPDPQKLTPSGIVAHAYLFKNLEFAIPFEPLERSGRFRGEHVRAFGIADHGRKTKKIGRQVLILDHASGDDFVIELRTKSAGDRLILAKVPPKKTLLETVRHVLARTGGGGRERLVKGDSLVVPKINFDLTRRYTELIGRPLVNRKGHGYPVVEAIQRARFRLDERGALLTSEMHLFAFCVVRHHLVFDRPFLVLMLREGREVPYFALWIDNAELLVPGEPAAPVSAARAEPDLAAALGLAGRHAGPHAPRSRRSDRPRPIRSSAGTRASALPWLAPPSPMR